MGFQESFDKTKKLAKRFWRSDNSKIALIRDILVALFFVLIILMALWVYTGQWFGTPLVAIESGSMMHGDEPFGRIGTIDAGDMVLLVKVNEKNDVKTFSTSNDYSYGKKGDVVIYHPDGNFDLDQIIHRAMCWIEVEYEGNDKFYTIEEYGIIHQDSSESLYIPECGIWNPSSNSSVHIGWFEHSGFITKGDNPDTNPTCDQLGGISRQPIKIEWISGKASLELPWIGTINLLFNDLTNGKSTLGNIPQDSLICFVILIAFLISIPISLDVYSWYKERKNSSL